jgi:GNAT superfamily N-acetyltransferase
MRARLAVEADIGVVGALSRDAHEEGRYSRYPMNEDKVYSLFHLALRGEDFFCVVVEHEYNIVGLMYGVVTDHFFSDMRYAANVALYVTPKFRGTWAAPHLVREFERVAIERGANEILIGNASGVDAVRTVEFYHALGYQPVGANCVKYIGE